MFQSRAIKIKLYKTQFYYTVQNKIKTRKTAIDTSKVYNSIMASVPELVH